jgi:hypothetical protein
MINKIIFPLLLLFVSQTIQSQQIHIKFIKDSKFELKEYDYPNNKKNRIEENINFLVANTIVANQSIKLILADYNKNNSFLDFYGESFGKGYDGLIITSNQNKKLVLHKRDRTKLYSKTTFTINGSFYTLTNIQKKTDNKYTADIIKENTTKKTSQTFITQLPENYSIKNSLIYFNFLTNENSYFHFSTDYKKLMRLQNKYQNLVILNFLVYDVNNGLLGLNYAAKKFKINTKHFILIDKNDFSLINKIGFNNNFKNGYLFNTQSKLVLSNLNFTLLKEFLKNHSKENFINSNI